MSYMYGDVKYWGFKPNEHGNKHEALRCSCGEKGYKIHVVGPRNSDDISEKRLGFAYCIGCGRAWFLLAEDYRTILNGSGEAVVLNQAGGFNMTGVTEYMVSEPPDTRYVLKVSRVITSNGYIFAILMKYTHYYVFNHKRNSWNRLSEYDYILRVLPDRFKKTCGYEYNAEAVIQGYCLGPSIEELLGKETK